MAKRINLFGFIGNPWRETDHQSFARQLASLGADADIELHINSQGGAVFDGIGIASSLRQHGGHVTVVIDALAASAASIVAMGGDEIVMSEGAMMMVHNPWLRTAGNSDQHRKSADVLDKIRDSMVELYRSQTGKSEAELRELLSEDTWLTAKEAVEHGFATRSRAEDKETSAALAALGEFDITDNPKVPEALRARVVAAIQGQTKTKQDLEGEDMAKEKTNQPGTGASAAADDQSQAAQQPQTQPGQSQSQARPAQQPQAAVAGQSHEDGMLAERQRAAEIGRLCAAVNVDAEFQAGLISRGVSADAASREILAHVASHGAQPRVNATPDLQVGVTGDEKFVQGASHALRARLNYETMEQGNPWASFTLMDLARESGRRAGMNMAGMTRSQLAGRILARAGHTTSDFKLILQSSINKGLLNGWNENPETWREWTREGTLTDFKETPRVALNLFGEYTELGEDGEIKFGTVGERAETVLLKTFAKGFRITRKALINDDLELLKDAPIGLGRAGARTVGSMVYGLLTGNVKMSDGVELFHASHKNTGAGALGIDTFSEAEAAMGTQKDPDDKAAGGLNIEPKYLLVPRALRRRAQELRDSDVDPDDTKRKNTLKGDFEVVAEGRLDADNGGRWYQAADQNLHNTCEVSFLDGVSEPTIEDHIDKDTKALEFTALLDVGASILDHRAFQRRTAP